MGTFDGSAFRWPLTTTADETRERLLTFVSAQAWQIDWNQDGSRGTVWREERLRDSTYRQVLLAFEVTQTTAGSEIYARCVVRRWLGVAIMAGLMWLIISARVSGPDAAAPMVASALLIGVIPAWAYWSEERAASRCLQQLADHLAEVRGRALPAASASVGAYR